MGRPKITEKRADQILDAFEICVARYGVEGATLEKVAAQARLSRALIRHHVGNKDELLESLVHRFFEKSTKEMAQMIRWLPEDNRSKQLVNYLFDSEYSDPQTVSVMNALITAAQENPDLASRIQGWFRDLVDAIETVLRNEFPEQTETRIQAVATGMIGIYLNVDSFVSVGAMQDLRDPSKVAAMMLLAQLKIAAVD